MFEIFFYKEVENGIIRRVGSSSGRIAQFVEITHEKHDELDAKMKSKPHGTLDAKYMLSDETEEFIEIETTHDEKVQWCFWEISDGKMTIEEVPDDLKKEVQQLLDSNKPSNDYGLPDETVQQIQDDTIANLIELGVL